MTKVCGIVYRVIFCKSLHRTPPSQLGFRRSTYSNNDFAGVLSAKLILVIKNCPQKCAVISSYCLAASIKVQFTTLLCCAKLKSLHLIEMFTVHLGFQTKKKKQLLCHLQHIVTLNHQTLIGKKLIVSPHGRTSSRIFFGGEAKKKNLLSFL